MFVLTFRSELRVSIILAPLNADEPARDSPPLSVGSVWTMDSSSTESSLGRGLPRKRARGSHRWGAAAQALGQPTRRSGVREAAVHTRCRRPAPRRRPRGPSPSRSSVKNAPRRTRRSAPTRRRANTSTRWRRRCLSGPSSTRTRCPRRRRTWKPSKPASSTTSTRSRRTTTGGPSTAPRRATTPRRRRARRWTGRRGRRRRGSVGRSPASPRIPRRTSWSD